MCRRSDASPPAEGGGWRVHGRDSEAARTAERTKNTGAAAGGYVYLHSAVDGFSRLAYTEALAGGQPPA